MGREKRYIVTPDTHNLMIGNKMKQVTTPLNNPMVIATGALIKAKVISVEIAKLVTSGTKKSQDAAKTKKQTVDLMVANGIKSFDLDLADKAKKEFCDSIKAAIVLGFDLDVQALLVKEPKTLGDMEKGVKRYWGQQIGSEFNYYKKALINREANPTGEISDKSTPVEMYFKDLKSALDRLAKIESVDFDLPVHTSALKKLLADK